MFFDYWEYMIWIAKLGLYVGTAFVIGGFFCYSYLELASTTKRKLLKYTALGATIGAISSIVGFLFLVGSFSNTGLLGVFNSFYFNFLIQTPIGHTHLIRAFCFFIMLGLILFKLKRQDISLSIIYKLVLLFLLSPIILSFSKLGHTTNSGSLTQLLISLHILTISIWMGSLYPLWLSSQTEKGEILQKNMVRFGQLAVFVVMILLICGASVALTLFQNWNEMIDTAYGQGFILKILLVASLLFLAACNKLYLTPRLQQDFYVKKLRSSISLEMIIGSFILIITAYITTVVGLG